MAMATAWTTECSAEIADAAIPKILPSCVAAGGKLVAETDTP